MSRCENILTCLWERLTCLQECLTCLLEHLPLSTSERRFVPRLTFAGASRNLQMGSTCVSSRLITNVRRGRKSATIKKTLACYYTLFSFRFRIPQNMACRQTTRPSCQGWLRQKHFSLSRMLLECFLLPGILLVRQGPAIM
jgi:hypothetical protein